MEIQYTPIVGRFVADKNHSSALFSVQHMKVSRFRASFGDIDASLVGDEHGLTLEGSAKVASISINNPPEFRAHVVDGGDFFDAGMFPEIRFRSTSFLVDDRGSVTAKGELTIRDVTHVVTATGTLRGPVADIVGGHSASLELNATVDRRDFGMQWQMALPDGDDVLGWEVELAVQLELHQTP